MNSSLVVSNAAPVRSRRWYSHPYNRAELYRIAALCARMLPRSGRHAASALLARLACTMLPVERENVRRNLGRVLSGADPSRLDAAVSAIFRNFALCFSDLLTVNRAPSATLHRYLEATHGEEHFKAASARGRGVIVATAHIGNWELGGRLLAAGWQRPTHVVLAAEEDPSIEAFLRQGGDGVRFVTRDSPTSSLSLLTALKRDEVVAVQGDRATGGRADVRLPFFGAPALFPIGPFVLARASGAPVLPAFCVLGEDARYRVFMEAPIWVERGNEEHGLGQL
ncbi:MAG TPA: lysophospholipid acyltransferase family protein, partial [Methylomirabilota bacterium]|nr:lysophospholipid acyltransferase family protein [Methylomirabilota bacterium]